MNIYNSFQFEKEFSNHFSDAFGANNPVWLDGSNRKNKLSEASLSKKILLKYIQWELRNHPKHALEDSPKSALLPENVYATTSSHQKQVRLSSSNPSSNHLS